MNKKLIEQLQILLEQASLKKDKNDVFRMKSYQQAIQTIQQLDYEIIEESQIPFTKKSKMYEKVLQFIKTGEIEAVKKVSQQIDIYKELLKITGVGPAKARELVENHSITSIEQLEKNTSLLNDKQKIGLKHYHTDQLRIPRKEIEQCEALLEKVWSSNIEWKIAGSYRRGAETSGDIDILLTHSNMEKFKECVDKLLEEKIIEDTLAYGDKKYMGYYCPTKKQIPRRIDILYCTPKEYPFALLYFTGSGPFNVKMREYASSKGYLLNEKGLFLNQKLIDCKTEKDIFTKLNLEYIEPKERKENKNLILL